MRALRQEHSIHPRKRPPANDPLSPRSRGTAGPTILERHGLPAEGFDTMVLVEDPGLPSESVSLRSAAALAVWRHMGRRWAPPRALRGWCRGRFATRSIAGSPRTGTPSSPPRTHAECPRPPSGRAFSPEVAQRGRRCRLASLRGAYVHNAWPTHDPRRQDPWRRPAVDRRHRVPPRAEGAPPPGHGGRDPRGDPHGSRREARHPGRRSSPISGRCGSRSSRRRPSARS